MTELQEQRMMVRAIRERWNVPQEYRDAIIKRLMRTVADPESSNRDVTAAARAVMAAEAQNIEDEQYVSKTVADGNRFAAIAEKLGIDLSTGTVQTGRGTIDSVAVERSGTTESEADN